MRILVLCLIGLFSPSLEAGESDYQSALCQGMRQEVTLANGARADCLSLTHAIEVEFSEKWAEALGQSPLYAATIDPCPTV